jgi:hypothetical protein
MDTTHYLMRCLRARRRGPIAITLAALAAVALLVAGCGGSSSGGNVAHVESASSSSTASAGEGTDPSGSQEASAEREKKLAAYSQCMRTHGVPEFPEPVEGHLQLNSSRSGAHASGVDPESAQFKAAQRACKSLQPAGLSSPAQSSELQGKALKFAACMRSHGVPNFPDPQVSEGRVLMRIGAGVNPQSPQFQEAQSACRSLAPVGGGGG